MTRKEAMEYNDSLKKELEQAALQCGLEESVGTYIVDNFITVLPETSRKGMIFLGEDSASYKAGNIKIDLKKVESLNNTNWNFHTNRNSYFCD